MCNLHFSPLKKVEQSKFAILFLAIISMLGHSCSYRTKQNNVEEMERLVWTHPDSCLLLLSPFQDLDTVVMSALELQLCYEYAFLRTNQFLHNDSLVENLANSFLDKNDIEHAGCAYYLLGTHFCLQNDAFRATYYLKIAEHLLLQQGKYPSELLGMVYYRLGHVLNTERLYHLSNDYFRKAIYYLHPTQNDFFLASAFRDYALSLPAEANDSCTLYLDSALMYAQKCSVNWLEQDIQCAMLEVVPHSEKEEEIAYYHVLCDSLGIQNVAGDLATFYFEQGDMSLCKYYLDILQSDTCNSMWSKEHYESIYSSYLYAMGEKDSAIVRLQNLHQWQTNQIEISAYDRAYIIAQQLDVAFEREQTLKQRIDKQYLVIAISILTIILLYVVCIAMAARLNIRRKNESIQILKIKHEASQKILQHLLQNRITQAKQIQQMLLLHKNVEVPIWTKTYYDSLLFTTTEQITKFHEDFNNAYDNLLDRLKIQYPDLTQMDLTLIALIYMGLSNEDCYLLLNMTKQSFYNRRQRVRNHLGDNHLDIEKWIKDLGVF